MRKGRAQPWQPLPCCSIAVLGALESGREDLEPSQLLTWEPRGLGAAWVCLGRRCPRRSCIHGAWPGGVLRTKSQDVASSPRVQSHPMHETSSRQGLRGSTRQQSYRNLPRMHKALRGCQDAHRLPRCRLFLCNLGPCPTSKHLWIIWENRMMAHPCGREQGMVSSHHG